MTDIQTITVEDYHQVASVSGNRVTFAEPIMYAVEAKWGWKIRKYPIMNMSASRTSRSRVARRRTSATTLRGRTTGLTSRST